MIVLWYDRVVSVSPFFLLRFRSVSLSHPDYQQHTGCAHYGRFTCRLQNRAEMKHTSQWLLLHSFYHLSGRAPPWAHIQPANIDTAVAFPISIVVQYNLGKKKKHLVRTSTLSSFLVAMFFSAMQM